jgi:glycine cleavage system transcriptional repressor
MTSAQQAILVATGLDRPGVMDEVADWVIGHGGAVADSRSMNLRGQFALLVLVGGPPEVIAELRGDTLNFAERVGIHARMEDAPATAPGDTFPYRFTATGRNHPKVIHGISHLMRVLNINIESLQTQESGHNGAAERAFRMELGLAVPRGVPIVKLREYLDHLCQEMEVAYELSTM